MNKILISQVSLREYHCLSLCSIFTEIKSFGLQSIIIKISFKWGVPLRCVFECTTPTREIYRSSDEILKRRFTEDYCFDVNQELAEMLKILFCVAVALIWKGVCAQDASDEDFPAFSEKSLCGDYLNKTASGSFKLHIHNLPAGECYWFIQPNGTNATVNLFFHTLFLHQDDELTLYRSLEDAQNETSPLLTDPIRAQNGSITVITKETTVAFKLKGKDTSFDRNFEGAFSSPGCNFQLIPTLQIIHSPIRINKTEEDECHYTYNRDPHKRAIPVFFFEEYNFTKSSVSLEGSTVSGDYKNDHPIDFFPLPESKTMTLKVSYPDTETTDYFRLKMQFVDSNCSGEFTINDLYPIALKSPVEILDNGTLVMECRWVIKHGDSSKVLGLTFEDIKFTSVFDMVAINNGLSEISSPLLQITTSNRNLTLKQEIRSSQQFMWISFKPVTYSSVFSARVTVHQQGGYHRGNGTIPMKGPTGNDTVILLEVNSNKIVSLKFSGEIAPPGTLKIFDDFNYDNMLASLQGKIWYPVLSKSSRMMIVPDNLASGSFDVSFDAVNHSCLYMSTLSADSYILNGNCGTSCLWVIPPQSISNYVMLLDIQHISLRKGDQIEVYKTDDKKTHLGTITSGMTYVPQLFVQANVGALVNVTQAECKKAEERVVLIGHSSYIPGCDKVLTPEPSEVFQIESPNYPDNYPVFASCVWNVTVSKNILHLSFQSLKLAENHCIKISENSKKYQFSGHLLPEDLFLDGDTIIKFDSTNCNISQNSEMLISDEGFVLNGTIADCGAILDGKSSGEFNTSLAINKKYCIWKIKVPANDGTTVNIISYTIAMTDDKGNYEFHVYDGASVRESEIINNTKTDIWSRTNSLIFVYKRLNASKPSSTFVVKYDTVGCNTTMQCENKLCLHPDWRCNGINECGDFTDERNCASVPIPPDVTLSGYSDVAFWLTAFVMLIVGLVLAVSVPYFYQKYKNGQYRRFGEISVIE